LSTESRKESTNEALPHTRSRDPCRGRFFGFGRRRPHHGASRSGMPRRHDLGGCLLPLGSWAIRPGRLGLRGPPNQEL